MAESRASNRAGAYEQQGAFRTFRPKPFPPNPPIDYSLDLLHQLSLADRAVARLDGATEVLPNPDLFVYMFARKEAVRSSQIEGTQATLEDVIKAEAGVPDPDLPDDVEEATAYIAAMNQGLSRLASLPLSLRLLREVHAALLGPVSRGKDKTPGEFRTSQVLVGPPGCTAENATYIPPSPKHVTDALRDLERFFHDNPDMPFLVKVGLVHAQFETIHPFLDGNGRVGRLLITLMLCEKGIISRPLLYLSSYLKEHQAEYYRRLQDVHEFGRWEEWLMFFLQGVAETGNQAAHIAKKIVQLREQHRQSIVTEMGKGAGSALAVLEALYKLPIISFAEASQVAQVEIAPAGKIVHKLEALGIVREITGRRRNQRFLYHEYFGLFNDT
ncbi:MAG: Fic family protein [Planctomycetes bacterium]|jgi:Fic family protein|nr:Fic family protein [Planctomycetota bacterium]